MNNPGPRRIVKHDCHISLTSSIPIAVRCKTPVHTPYQVKRARDASGTSATERWFVLPLKDGDEQCHCYPEPSRAPAECFHRSIFLSPRFPAMRGMLLRDPCVRRVGRMQEVTSPARSPRSHIAPFQPVTLILRRRRARRGYTHETAILPHRGGGCDS